jgi:hypothetical protein
MGVQLEPGEWHTEPLDDLTNEEYNAIPKMLGDREYINHNGQFVKVLCNPYDIAKMVFSDIKPEILENQWKEIYHSVE